MTPITISSGATDEHQHSSAVREINMRKMRVSFLLTAFLLVLYLGFMVLVAFAKALLAVQVVEGLSVAIILGATVIVGAGLLALIYVIWANKHHDSACDRLGQKGAT